MAYVLIGKNEIAVLGDIVAVVKKRSRKNSRTAVIKKEGNQIVGTSPGKIAERIERLII